MSAREPRLSDNLRVLISVAITGNEAAATWDESIAAQAIETLASEATVLANAWRSRHNADVPVMLEERDLVNCLSRFVIRARATHGLVALLEEQEQLYGSEGESEAAE